MVSNFTFANLIPFSVIFSVVSFLLLPLFCSFSPKCHTEHHLQLSGGLQIMQTLVLLLEQHRRQWNIEATIPCEHLLESSLLWEHGSLSQLFASRFGSPLPHCHPTAPLTPGPGQPPFYFWSLRIGLLFLGGITHTVFVFLWRAYFTYHGVLKNHPRWSIQQDYLLFQSWIIVHHMCIPHAVYLFIHRLILRLLLLLGFQTILWTWVCKYLF